LYAGRALHEHLSNARDTHTLVAWQAQLARWERLRVRLSARTGTAAESLSMFTACHEERLRVEAALAAELSQPLEERLGAAAWAVSLRDNWQLLMPVGAPESDLVSLRSLAAAGANRLTMVRTPGHGAEEAAAAARHARAVRAHRAPGAWPLCLEGRGLTQHLRSLVAAPLAADSLARFLSAHSQAECAGRLLAANGAVKAASAAAANECAARANDMPTPFHSDFPQLVAYFRGEGLPSDDAEANALAAAAAAGPLSLLRLSCEPRALQLLPPAGDGGLPSRIGEVTLLNEGTVVVFFSWQFSDAAGCCRDEEAHTQFEAVSPEPNCALLPGDSVQCAFRLRPQGALQACEIWKLCTDAQLPEGPLELLLCS
jgi:hypothetical protein